ncbi:hypothetical protein ES711_06840 [Gelidibacter salicanalis]|uniref:50S ribosomal protein L27 n=1 Tax=Gelidibacter salicanalis TaxID=291193 RepID=A0A5C7AHM2_9FLAO|nr:hypothetical protein [Gelidibacter salicanalis]TXE08220.1 hypothetical protein ES711_06840 [Gelidibacter salicanalis]
MYETVKMLHSYWAYLTLLMIVIAALNALVKYFGKKEFHPIDFRISLFTLIVSHIQLLIGLIVLFAGPYFTVISELGMKNVMGDKLLRSNIIEHPLMMIIAVVLITIGYSKHKKKLTSTPKFKVLAIFYTLALISVLAKIPWNTWF